ncbi:phage tail tape measure protein [Yokenella regensburgei]|uniref:phage tail tape measure protein n=1 Tax=Yokenella regensburgei TaxID=158877 RepID=UPI003EDAE4D2
MSDVASLSVALHLNSAAFKSQITDAYQKAGQASKKFNDKATAQAKDLSEAITRTVNAAKGIGFQAANADVFSGATRGAGRLNYVLHEVAAGSNVASSSIINALIPAVHSLKGQLDGSAGGWKTQQEAARKAADELASAAQSQIAMAQAEKQAALNKAAIAEKTIAAAQAQREQAIALDDYYAKQTEVNKQFGLNVSYQDEHLKNERAIIEANKLEAGALEKLKAAKAGVVAAELAETGGKAALVASTEAAAAANTQLTVTQRIAAASSRALGSAMSLLGGPVGIGLTALAAGGTYLYSEFKKAEEQTKKLNSTILDLKTSSQVSASELRHLADSLGGTTEAIDAVTLAAKAGFTGDVLQQVAKLADEYTRAGGNASDMVNTLSSLSGDPLSAMQVLTRAGVILSDETMRSVIAESKRGDAIKANQTLFAAAMEELQRRTADVGKETDTTKDKTTDMFMIYGAMGPGAVRQLQDMSAETRNLGNRLSGLVGALQSDLLRAQAAHQKEILENTKAIDHYITAGITPLERRNEALKRLNDSAYAKNSKEYATALKGINEEYEKAIKGNKPKAETTKISEGQRLLEQAQQHNAVLQEQAQTTDAMSESARQLVVFDQKISGLKGQHLTADQQSLVNMQGQIRAQLQSNVLLEKEAALRKVSEKYLAESRKWKEEEAAMRLEASQSLGQYTQSDRESADAEARIAIINRFNQRRIALEKDFGSTTSAEYQARLADLEKAKGEELAIVEQSAQDKLAAEADYTAGFRRGTRNWIDSARDANNQMANFSTGLFDGMTDSLTSFVTTGKLSFRDFTTSVLADLAKISMRIALSSALQSIFGAAFSGGSGGGGTPSGAYDSAAAGLKFDVNAKGGVYDSPSLSVYSGGVYNSPQVFAFAKGAGVFGEAGPEAIMPLTRGADGSLGVRAVGAQGGQSTGSMAPVVYITVQGDGGTNTQTTGGWEQFGKEIGNFVDQRYRQLRNADLRPGGAIWNSSNGRR